MKIDRSYIQLLLSVAFILFISVKIQAQYIEAERDKIFEHVDLTQVPYGILEDYGLSPVSLLPYTKHELDTTNYLNYVTLQQVMLGLNSSLVPARQSSRIDIDKVNRLNEAYYHKGIVPITLLRYDLSRFSEAAAHREDVYALNGQIMVRKNLSRSPYERLSLFAASPFTSEFDSREVSFFIPQDLICSNSHSIAKIEIQFAEGEAFRSIAIGEHVKYRYPTDGLKVVTIRVQHTGSRRWYSSHFPIIIAPKLVTKRAESIPGLVEIPIVSNKHLHSGGTLQYKLSPRNRTGKFRKPLLIVEGFDLYPVVRQDPKSNFDMDCFFQDRWRLNKILDLGYDVAYLDYGDGMDDIRRNAILFQEALRYINEHKEGNEKNVVVGLSMGGLVASYGLRKMELAGEDHETRKYISYDSPHMGANVPMGAYYMLYHWLYGDEFFLLRSALDYMLYWEYKLPMYAFDIEYWLKKPAVSQLLPFDGPSYASYLYSRLDITHDRTNPFDNTYNIPTKPNEDFFAFHEEYEQLGLPQKTFNVAFSNGSIKAPNILMAGGPIAEVNVSASGVAGFTPAFLASLFSNPEIRLNWTPLTGSKLTSQVYVCAMPCKVPYYLDIALTKKYLGIFSHTYHISRMQIQVPTCTPRYSDVGVGGTFYLNKSLFKSFDWELFDPKDSNLNALLSWFLSVTGQVKVNTEYFCFVPLNSSLGISLEKLIFSLNDARKESPFDQIYTANGTKSEQHISLDGHFQNLITELQYNIPKDYRPQLDTTATICDCGTALQVLNPIEGLTYEWHTSMTLEALNYNRGIRTTVTPKRDLATNQPQGEERKWPLDQGFVYVDAYLNGRKFSTSDTCYVYIGRPYIKASTIAQLEVENGYQGRYLPYPTVQIDWNRWGNITGVEWDKAPLTATAPHQGFIIKDIDFVQQDLDQEAYEAVSSPSMIRYELQTQSGVTDWSDKLIGPDGKPISPKIDFEEPPLFKEARQIPSRTLRLNYIPSNSLFDESGEYTLTYRLVNECGKSTPKKFTYHFMDQPILLSVTPTIVTDVDAVLRYGLVSSTGLELRPMPKDFDVSYVRYPYGIWSATGVLQHMGETRVGEPLGVIKLPPGQYVIKVWYRNAYKEFHVIRQ